MMRNGKNREIFCLIRAKYERYCKTLLLFIILGISTYYSSLGQKGNNREFNNNQYFLYYATRDPDFKIQMLGVAVAPGNTHFERKDWHHLSTEKPILKPELPWELDCVEGASVIEKNNELFMFYAGGYNNDPQQVGVAKSTDGIHWKRLFSEPFLSNGKPGEWNSSESGHPHIFEAPDGSSWLFFQGNNDNGQTWFISNKEVVWKNNLPKIQ